MIVSKDHGNSHFSHARSAVVPVSEGGEHDNPQQLAHTVFDAFLGLARDAAARGNGHDLPLWHTQLQRCMSDERLLDRAAASHFEHLIAQLLADGWRAGHDNLFVAASEFFSWTKDRSRLLAFGDVGARLSQAIDEWQQFTKQDNDEHASQVAAVARVRADAEPDTKDLLTHAPHLRNMVARFPVLVGIIADSERVHQWLAREQTISRWRRWRFARSASGTGRGIHWQTVLLVFLVVDVIFLLYKFGPLSPTSPTSPPSLAERPRATPPRFDPRTDAFNKEDAETRYRRAAGELYIAPAKGKAEPAPVAKRAAPAQRRMLNNAEMDAMFERVQFDWPEGSYGKFNVNFSVELDERGAITKITRTASSKLPMLDQRVEDAIRAAAPFGEQITRSFKLRTSWKHLAPREQTAPERIPASDEAKP